MLDHVPRFQLTKKYHKKFPGRCTGSKLWRKVSLYEQDWWTLLQTEINGFELISHTPEEYGLVSERCRGSVSLCGAVLAAGADEAWTGTTLCWHWDDGCRVLTCSTIVFGKTAGNLRARWFLHRHTECYNKSLNRWNNCNNWNNCIQHRIRTLHAKQTAIQ